MSLNKGKPLHCLQFNPLTTTTMTNTLNASLTIPINSPNSPAVTSFEFAPGMTLRSFTHNGEPHFIAKDVCEALGYANGPDALADHVDPDDRFTIAIRYGIRGNPVRTVITESGLYALIMRSNKPEAKGMQRWVTKTVLPALRAGGVYVLDQENADLASMGYSQMQAHIEDLKQKVAAAETIRWARHQEEKDARREGFRLLKSRSYRPTR